MQERITETSTWLTEGISKEKLKSEEILAIISATIELKRHEMKMDQKQFAKFMGVSQGMVSKWESGFYNFTISTLVSICEKLGLEFEPQITSKEVKVLVDETNKSTIFTFSDIQRHGYNSWLPKSKKPCEGDAA